MFRRSSLCLRNLLSACAYGRSLNAGSLTQCHSAELYPFRSPVGVVSPIWFRVSQFVRQYSGEADKEVEAINVKENEEINAEKSEEISTENKKTEEEINVKSKEDTEEIKVKLREYLKKYGGMTDEQTEELIAKADAATDDPVIRYEDLEPELKIYEDPILDRPPPPEPDEQTKRDVADLIETLKKLVDQMPMQKMPQKKVDDHRRKGNTRGGGRAR